MQVHSGPFAPAPGCPAATLMTATESGPSSEPPRPPPRRSIYLLPNLFTTGGLFAGFYAIIAAANGDFTSAAIAVFVAGLLDGWMAASRG